VPCVQETECQIGRAGDRTITSRLCVLRQSQDHLPFRSSRFRLLWTTLCEDGPNTRSKRDPTLNKRYGCIFTCLRYRAVHIEVAEDLSADSFINAVLRFVGRRGPPTVIYSDNGTNFRGAELDVVKAMKVWDQEKIQATLTQRGINWKFNPPAASHRAASGNDSYILSGESCTQW